MEVILLTLDVLLIVLLCFEADQSDKSEKYKRGWFFQYRDLVPPEAGQAKPQRKKP